MTLEKIIEKCRESRIIQERCRDDSYFEFVVLFRDLEEWNSIFTQFFGPPCKAAGREPEKESLDLTRNFGSLRPEQILYKKELEKYIKDKELDKIKY